MHICRCIYIYVHIYMHICLHICSITHTQIALRTCVHWSHPHFCTSTHFHVHTHLDTRLLFTCTHLKCNPFFPCKFTKASFSLVHCCVRLLLFFNKSPLCLPSPSLSLSLTPALSPHPSLSASPSLSRYTAALGEVQTLKVKLQSLTQEEFKKDATSIKRRLDLALRSRFVPESIVTSVALYGDVQVGNVCVCECICNYIFGTVGWFSGIFDCTPESQRWKCILHICMYSQRAVCMHHTYKYRCLLLRTCGSFEFTPECQCWKCIL